MLNFARDFKISSLTTFFLNSIGLFHEFLINLAFSVGVGLLAPVLKSLVLLLIAKIKKYVQKI